MARWRSLILVLAIESGGCVSTSVVQPAGEGKFITGTEAKMAPGTSWADLKSLTLKQAVSYCAGDGKDMHQLDYDTHGAKGWTPISDELTFSCVDYAPDKRP